MSPTEVGPYRYPTRSSICGPNPLPYLPYKSTLVSSIISKRNFDIIYTLFRITVLVSYRLRFELVLLKPSGQPLKLKGRVAGYSDVLINGYIKHSICISFVKCL